MVDERENATHHNVSVIVRDKDGKLVAPIDRDTLSASAIEAALDGLRKDGARMVLVLLEDDSIHKHWTMPR